MPALADLRRRGCPRGSQLLNGYRRHQIAEARSGLDTRPACQGADDPGTGAIAGANTVDGTKHGKGGDPRSHV